MAPDVPAGTMLWLARGEQGIPGSNDWLTADEAARASATPFTKRRTEYLLRRWVCKQAVAAVAGLPDDLRSLARIEVTNRATGAPAVVVDGEEAGLDVSLSDRAGWAVCVVGEALGRLGCDLEIVEPRSAGFVADFLTAAEREYVAAQGSEDHDLAANLIWSAKESALKVLQTGLRRDTRSVEVVVGEPDGATGWAALEVRPAEGGVLPGWWRRAGTFVVTVAAEAPLRSPTALVGSGDLETARPVHSWVDRPLSG
ncbi:MAG TPA: 4'-phosphopantetheinyl transferase superfamily protein [Nocardioides sp.]|jgi:4'-phosphopantetheinyl transferase|nr:4'-phosphopantetheinyl transferase superfamily protein [Nocardioides sp.]